jgi:hypothetical protein
MRRSNDSELLHWVSPFLDTYEGTMREKNPEVRHETP